MKTEPGTKWLLGVARRRLNGALDRISGRPSQKPFPSCQTLEKDDLRIALGLLKKLTAVEKDTRIVTEYEREFATWNGSRHAFAFSSGREALSACISAAGLEPGDEVILPGYTCVVVPNAFHFAGVKTIYSDIELDTYGLDASIIEAKITGNTRALLIHHLYGLVSRDYDRIIEIARKHGLIVIEDCAQATGAEYRGVKVGNRADFAFYSSEQSKVFNTIQGGMATTNNDTLAEKLAEQYNNASPPGSDWVEKLLSTLVMNYYIHRHEMKRVTGDIAKLVYMNKTLVSTTDDETKGVKPDYYGRRMAGPVARIGLNQLAKIDRFNKLRRETAPRWSAWCDSRGFKKPSVVDDSVPIFLRYPVIADPSMKLNTSWSYAEIGVEIGKWFISNLHPSKSHVDNCPNADIAVERCVNFPGIMP